MELFKIADGRTCFYQWDLDQQINVDNPDISEVHFCNGTSDCSLVVRVVDGAANVPNILLQIARSIRVYAMQDDHTCAESVFAVRQRTKPADYVYTETEVKRYEDLEKKIEEVRKSIPSVPVKSVNGKTGEVQLSASDVGALPSNTPIPGAYTLPTASAEVKGGVKVGTGLQMNGEALEVVPEKNFELIETYTTTESIKSILRKAEPDGTEYKFNEMLAQLSFPLITEDYATGNIEVSYRDTSGKRIYAGFSATLNAKSAKYYVVITALIRIQNGVIEGRSNIGLNNALENASKNVGPLANYIGENEKIGEYYVYVTNGIPVGSTLEIYGVRA